MAKAPSPGWPTLLAAAALALAGAFPGGAGALPPGVPLRALVRDHYRDRDGLPQNAIRAILHARSGPLWIATDEGLARFDGAEIVQVGRRREPGLPSEIVTALAETPDGTVWVGTYDAGVARYRAGRFEGVTIPGAPAALRVSALLVDRAGGLWVGSSSGVFHVAGDRSEAFTMASGLPDDRVNVLAEDRDGAIWVSLHRGLARIADGRVQPGPAELAGLATHALCPDPAGGVWIGTTDRGLAHAGRDGVTFLGAAQGLPADTITALLVDRDGSLWVGLQISGLARVRQRVVERFTTREGLAGDWISVLLEDREGSIWLGTQDAGLMRLRDADFRTYGAAEGLSHDSVESLLVARNGDLWVATDGGVDQARGGAMPPRRVVEGVPMSLLEDRGGAIWIGTFAQGVSRWSAGHVTRLEHAMPSGTWVRALVEDREGVIWAGTTDGLYRVHGTRLAQVGDGLPVERPGVVAMAETGSGLFVATEGAGVFRRGGGRFIKEEAGPPDGWVVSGFLADADGTLWLATQGGGLWRRRGGAYARVSTSQGLHSDTIWTVLDDRRGALWITTNRGICRVARSDVEAVMDGRAPRLSMRVWSMDDGLRSQESAGLSHPGAWRAPDGRLWFATLRGAAVVDPARLRPDPPPPATTFQRVAISGVPQDPGAVARLPAGAGRLELEFDANLLLGQRRANFRYRLTGFEEGWTEAAPSRAAQYTNLPAGDYRFEVQARLDEGAWGPEAALEVRQAGPAWRSPPALIGAAAVATLAAAALRLLLRRRVAARRREEAAALVAARAEIAALSALLPRCGWCHEPRRDAAYLTAVEAAMRARPPSQFDGGLCPACAARHAAPGAAREG